MAMARCLCNAVGMLLFGALCKNTLDSYLDPSGIVIAAIATVIVPSINMSASQSVRQDRTDPDLVKELVLRQRGPWRIESMSPGGRLWAWPLSGRFRFRGPRLEGLLKRVHDWLIVYGEHRRQELGIRWVIHVTN